MNSIDGQIKELRRQLKADPENGSIRDKIKQLEAKFLGLSKPPCISCGSREYMEKTQNIFVRDYCTNRIETYICSVCKCYSFRQQENSEAKKFREILPDENIPLTPEGDPVAVDIFTYQGGLVVAESDSHTTTIDVATPTLQSVYESGNTIVTSPADGNLHLQGDIEISSSNLTFNDSGNRIYFSDSNNINLEGGSTSLLGAINELNFNQIKVEEFISQTLESNRIYIVDASNSATIILPWADDGLFGIKAINTNIFGSDITLQGTVNKKQNPIFKADSNDTFLLLAAYKNEWYSLIGSVTDEP